MKIIIRRDDNEMEATYEVNETEQTIYDLKEMISKNNFGPIIEEQRLEFNKKRLKNSHFISYYQVKEKSVIILKQQSASTSSSNTSTPSVSDGDEDPEFIPPPPPQHSNNNQDKWDKHTYFILKEFLLYYLSINVLRVIISFFLLFFPKYFCFDFFSPSYI